MLVGVVELIRGFFVFILSSSKLDSFLIASFSALKVVASLIDDLKLTSFELEFSFFDSNF